MLLLMFLFLYNGNSQVNFVNPSYGSHNINTNSKVLIQFSSNHLVDTVHLNWEPYEIEDNIDTVNFVFYKTVVTFFDSDIYDTSDSSFFESIYCFGHFEFVDDTTFYIVPNDELNYAINYGIRIDDLYINTNGVVSIIDTVLTNYFTTKLPVHKLISTTADKYMGASKPLEIKFNRNIANLGIGFKEFINVINSRGDTVVCDYYLGGDSTSITLRQKMGIEGSFDLGDQYMLKVNLDRITGDTTDIHHFDFSFRKTYYVTVGASSLDNSELPAECYPFYKPERIFLNAYQKRQITANQVVGDYQFSHWESSFEEFDGNRNISITMSLDKKEFIGDGWINAVYTNRPFDTLYVTFKSNECSIQVFGAEINSSGRILIHKDSVVSIVATAGNGFAFSHWESSFPPFDKKEEQEIYLSANLPKTMYGNNLTLTPVVFIAQHQCNEKKLSIVLKQPKHNGEEAYLFNRDIADLVEIEVTNGPEQKDYIFPTGSDNVVNDDNGLFTIPNTGSDLVLTIKLLDSQYEIYQIDGSSVKLNRGCIHENGKVIDLNGGNTFTGILKVIPWSNKDDECVDNVTIYIRKKPVYLFAYSALQNETPAELDNNLDLSIIVNGKLADQIDKYDVNMPSELLSQAFLNASYKKFPFDEMLPIGGSTGPEKLVRRIRCVRLKGNEDLTLKPSINTGYWDNSGFFRIGNIDQTTQEMDISIDESRAVQHLFPSSFKLLAINVVSENGTKKTFSFDKNSFFIDLKESEYYLKMNPRSEMAKDVKYASHLLRHTEPHDPDYRFSYTTFEFVFSMPVDLNSLKNNLYIADVNPGSASNIKRIDGELLTRYEEISSASSSNIIQIKTINSEELECPHMSEIQAVVNKGIKSTNGKDLDLFGFDNFKRIYETETPRISIRNKGFMVKHNNEDYDDELVFQVATGLVDNTDNAFTYHKIQSLITNQLPYGYTGNRGDYINAPRNLQDKWRDFNGVVYFLQDQKIKHSDALIYSNVVTEIDYGDVNVKANRINEAIDILAETGEFLLPKSAFYIKMAKKIIKWAYVSCVHDNDDIEQKLEVMVSKKHLWGCDRLYKNCEVVFPNISKENQPGYKVFNSHESPRYLLSFYITLD